MKKLVTAACALAAGLALAEEPTGVVSGNTVGYQEFTVQGKQNGNTTWYQFGVQFKGVGAAEDTIAVTDAITSSDLPAVTWRNKSTGPQLQFWDGVGYANFYYISNAYGTPAKTSGDNRHTGWANDNQVLASTDLIGLGKAFWFKADNIPSGSTATLKIVGEVLAEGTKTLPLASGDEWAMLSDPFPADVIVTNIACSLPAVTWRNKSTGAQIQIWDGEGYANFYYISNAYGTPAKTSGDNRHTGWANDSQVLAGETINAGTGFWVKNPSKAAGTLTFTLQ